MFDGLITLKHNFSFDQNLPHLDLSIFIPQVSSHRLAKLKPLVTPILATAVKGPVTVVNL